ncbi:hypothetical protein IKG20_00865 [Candidatus Saccharibacteria bacterium]|nr:hypothetical protein [Candidatus Saccharibacteria bacterium]
MTNQQQATSLHAITVVEGRPENHRMVSDYGTAAVKRGWDFIHLKKINSDTIARNDFGKIPLSHVIMRSLTDNDYAETERFLFWLKAQGIPCINGLPAGGRICTSDKHFQQGLFVLDPVLKNHALPTFEAKFKENVIDYIKSDRIHYPFLLKPRLGTTGAGIILIKSRADLDKINDYKGYIIEQYIKPECDYRVFVIGGTAVGVMRKEGDPERPDNFKIWSSGYKRSPETDPNTLDIVKNLAVHAADISRLEYAGVDIVKEAKTGKYYILETNYAAGWGNNFIEVTNVDIPSLTIDWFEDIDYGRQNPVFESVEKYINRRLKNLPTTIRRAYECILEGDPNATKDFRSVFGHYKDNNFEDAGFLFKHLEAAYLSIISNPDTINKYRDLLFTLNSLPMSWAGNFIGPKVGNLHDGAILSALYLYLLHKSDKI